MASPYVGTRPLSPAQQSSATIPPPPPSPSRIAPSLDLLPNELILPIAVGLVPAAPSTTRFALRPDGTWETRDADHQWADWLTAYKSLLAFVQTSHRISSLAKPFLYHTLVIRDAAGLVTLCCRMRQRPEIKPWIRKLTCLANITGVATIDDLHREWYRQTGGTRQIDDSSLPSLRPPSIINRGSVLWKSSHPAADTTIGLVLLQDVVLNAPNLRDLLFAFPDHELPGPEPGPNSLDLLDPGFQDALLRSLSSDSPATTDGLPFTPYLAFLLKSSASSLRIYCHRENLDRELSFSRVIADFTVENLASFTNLRSLELCCSSFGNFTPDNLQLPPLPHIENLRLYGSYLHEPRLVAICLACVSLQTLLVHFERSTTDEDRDFLPEGKTLSDALAGLAGTLRSLELVPLAEGHYITRGRERPRKPENHRLKCLPELTKLETLTLDYRGFFGTFGILDEDDAERLCQLLPASLRRLTMVCEWGTAKDWKQIYLSNLDTMLYGVKCLCSTTSLRQLQSVSLAIHSWPAKSRFAKRFNREVGEAKLHCERAGVSFRTFDLFPCYQDEDEVDPGDDGEFEDEEGGEEAEGLEEEEIELEDEDEASEYYISDDESDPEREAQRPATFAEFLERLPEDHGHSFDELFYAFHEDRWDEYLF